jgi:hypothetical protein
MRVDIKSGGDGVACWNAEAIAAYEQTITARESARAEANPDLTVTPARLKCYGCEELEFDMGTRCTAELTHTIYSVQGEICPRESDATGSLGDIPGLRTRIDSEHAVDQTPEIHAAADTSVPQRRSGLLGLLGRRG